MNGPSPHLTWDELKCKDGTEYPSQWRQDRATKLAVTFEDVRVLLGSQPLHVNSGYRTPSYNARLEGAAVKSQHVEGRAIDFRHPTMTPKQVYTAVYNAHKAGKLPLLGGLGLYATFVHMDVRTPATVNHLATWSGRGVTLPKL
jgi:uncharacterized protein YcbK (DUF882 family)